MYFLTSGWEYFIYYEMGHLSQNTSIQHHFQPHSLYMQCLHIVLTPTKGIKYCDRRGFP